MRVWIRSAPLLFREGADAIRRLLTSVIRPRSFSSTPHLRRQFLGTGSCSAKARERRIRFPRGAEHSGALIDDFWGDCRPRSWLLTAARGTPWHVRDQHSEFITFRQLLQVDFCRRDETLSTCSRGCHVSHLTEQSLPLTLDNAVERH